MTNNLRYVELKQLARSKHHTLRLVAFAGQVETGDVVTVVHVTPPDADLDAALTWVEDYLTSEAADRRSDLAAELEKAQAASKDAFEAWQESRKALRAAEKAIQDDIDNAVLDAQINEALPEPAEDTESARESASEPDSAR